MLMWNWKLLSDAHWAGKMSSCLAWRSLFHSLHIVYRQHIQLQLTVFKYQLIMCKRIWKRHHTEKSSCLTLVRNRPCSGKSQSTVLWCYVIGHIYAKCMRQREKGGKRSKVFSSSAFWHLIWTEKVGDSQILSQVLYDDVKVLLDVHCLPNSRRWECFPQGAF